MNNQYLDKILKEEIQNTLDITMSSNNLEIRNLEKYLTEYNNEFYNNIVYEIKKTKKYYNDQRPFIMIGCGYLPLTLLTYYNYYPKSEFIGIDIDKNAIRSSNSLKESFRIQNVIFECLDAQEYTYENAGTILIAGMVKNKIDILNRISSTLKIGCKIFIRLFYDEDYEILEILNVENMKFKFQYKIDKKMFPKKEDYDLIILEKY